MEDDKLLCELQELVGLQEQLVSDMERLLDSLDVGPPFRLIDGLPSDG